MAKIKLTKGELKKQRDALIQYNRYLPTLQLKKQQLQMEILKQSQALEAKEHETDVFYKSVLAWAKLFGQDRVSLSDYIKIAKIITGTKNIAGVDLPVFEKVEFVLVEYDLFSAPLWVDAAVEVLERLISMREEVNILRQSTVVLRQELRITSQRVNLFEKVKIPQTEDAIRLIKIYIGDQLANAVGRSKIAKKKIENYTEIEALV